MDSREVFLQLATSAGIRAESLPGAMFTRGQTVAKVVKRIQEGTLQVPDSAYAPAVQRMLHVQGNGDRSVLQLECEVVIGLGIRYAA